MLRGHWLYYVLGSIIALLLPPGAAGQKPPLQPLTVVRLAAHNTANAIKSADLRGAIETLDADGETEKHAQFRLRFAENKYLVEMVPKKGFRYDRIVAVADETGVCEATFSDRIKPNGCAANLHERRELGEKPLVGDGPFLYHQGDTPRWLQGRLLIGHVLNNVPFESKETQAWRTPTGFSGSYTTDSPVEQINGEFEARRDFGNNLSRFSIAATGGGKTETLIEWKQVGKTWFVSSFEEKMWFQGEHVGHTRITFNVIKPNPKLDADLFSIASLGLVEGARLLDRHPNRRAIGYNYVTPNREGASIRVEATKEKRYVVR